MFFRQGEQRKIDSNGSLPESAPSNGIPVSRLPIVTTSDAVVPNDFIGWCVDTSLRLLTKAGISFGQHQQEYSQYPRYKHLAPEHPTEQQFCDAWETIFGFPPSQCLILGAGHDSLNTGFTVKTPTTTISNGGFGFHTEEPDLKPDQSFIYAGGCPWDTDKNGDRFYSVDPQTCQIVDLQYALAILTIQRGFLQHSHLLSAITPSTDSGTTLNLE